MVYNVVLTLANHMFKFKTFFKYLVITLALFLFVAFFQLQSISADVKERYAQQVGEWVNNDQNRQALYNQYETKCLKSKSFSEGVEERRKDFNLDDHLRECAASFGSPDLSTFITQIDYSAVDVPFPLSILTM